MKKWGIIFIPILGLLINVSSLTALDQTTLPLNTLENVELIPKKNQITLKLCFKIHPPRTQWKVTWKENVLLIYLKNVVVEETKFKFLSSLPAIKHVFVKQPSADLNIINIVLDRPVKQILKSVCYDYLDNRKIALILDVSKKSASQTQTFQSQTNLKKNEGVKLSLDTVRKEILAENEETAIDEVLHHLTSSPSQSTQPRPSAEENIEKTDKSKQSMPSSKVNLPKSLLGALFKSFSVLLVVLGTILISFWGWKKFLMFKQKKLGFHKDFIQILAVHHFSPKQMIVLVEIAGQKLVLGITPEQITTLAKLDETKEKNTNNVFSTEFAVNLQKETAKAEEVMSKAVEVLKEKMEQLKKV